MFGVVWVVTVVSVIALVVVAPNGRLAIPRGLANSFVVLVVMMLVPVIGAFLHNRTRARR